MNTRQPQPFRAMVACLAIAFLTLTLALRFAHSSRGTSGFRVNTVVAKVQHRCAVADSTVETAGNLLPPIPVIRSVLPLPYHVQLRTLRAERSLDVRPPPAG